jgi:alpha-galactosidase
LIIFAGFDKAHAYIRINRAPQKTQFSNNKGNLMRATKRTILLSVILIGFAISAAVAQTPQNTEPAGGKPSMFYQWALTPPMGWNSWDCYGAGVNQDNTLANADYMEKNLKSHGWNIITIDIQWYEPKAHTTEYRKGAIIETDSYGRLLPAANRFPMTKNSRSFKPIADYLHEKGLKFGLHLLRGIPRQAVDRDDTPILGTNYKASDIADKKSICPWNGDMYGVDMSKPGAQEYYDSVFALLASWDVDFIKVDDLSRPYHTPEIEAIRKAIDKTGRPIVFSTSPGATPLSEAEHIKDHANMWRISDDFWDNWGTLYSQFARLDNWSKYSGPGHWADADMLPLGNVRTWQEKDAWTHFTHDEQITLMSLWSIARSPLIMGGNMPKNDEFTLSLMTNDEVIAVNQQSSNNKQLFAANNKTQFAWLADVPGSKDKYVAIFNSSPLPTGGRRRGSPPGEMSPTANNPAASEPARISVPLADIGLTGPCRVRDLWAKKEIGTVNGEIVATVNSHGAVLYRVSPENTEQAVTANDSKPTSSKTVGRLKFYAHDSPEWRNNLHLFSQRIFHP